MINIHREDIGIIQRLTDCACQLVCNLVDPIVCVVSNFIDASCCVFQYCIRELHCEDCYDNSVDRSHDNAAENHANIMIAPSAPQAELIENAALDYFEEGQSVSTTQLVGETLLDYAAEGQV